MVEGNNEQRMARLIHSINITLGGSCHHTEVVADEDHHRYAHDLLVATSAVLLGRNTFELFTSFWPEAVNRSDLPHYMIDFASELDTKPKYVVSNRRLETNWMNVSLLRGPGLEDVQAMLNRTPGAVVSFGSPALAASLATEGLIDELHVVVQPFIGMASMRAFEPLHDRKQLALLEARRFRSGAVLLRYATQ